jgi:formate dehydrogenase major subunit
VGVAHHSDDGNGHDGDGNGNGNGGGRWGWPLLRQLLRGDLFALGDTAASGRTDRLRARTADADRVVRSICPYCAVGCGQKVYVKDERIIDIEGDPDSPISEGTLCPKGSATFQLVTGAHRVNQALVRRPGARDWEPIPLEEAMDRIADRVKEARDAGWESEDRGGRRLNRCMTVAHLGGATLDNEENYLIKKLLSGGLGFAQVENQARI